MGGLVGMVGELERWMSHFLKCDHGVVKLANFQTLNRVDFLDMSSYMDGFAIL